MKAAGRRRTIGGMRVLIAAVAAFLLVPAAAIACACCADAGYWSSATNRLRTYELGQLDRIRFSPSANTFVGTAGLDGVTGISAASTRYGLIRVKAGRRWTLRLRAPAGGGGSLSFDLPGSALLFATDLRDGRRSIGGGPLLYKEWRLGGTVSGTGDFLSATSGATYRLILHGRGNACLDARNFTRWTLQVRGAGARFTLFGSLRRPSGN